MPAKDGKKKGPTLPPKPSTVSEEQWDLAHSATKLLELLAAPDSSRGSSAASKAAEHHSKPLANKQTAALWLWQLVAASPDARDEAIKAGAVETCAKIASSHGSNSSSSDAHQVLVGYCLSTLTQLAAPSAGTQSSAAVREQLLTMRPLVLPALLGHLATASSTSLVAAAAGLLAVLACCPDTHGRVKKLMAGWGKAPLMSALVMQHSLPLVGGRNAAADAAAVLQAVCSPHPPPEPAATAAAAEDGTRGKAEGTGGKEGAASGKESSGGKAASTAAAGGSTDAAADASLTAAVQQSVLAADGLAGLLQVCLKAGSPAAARSEAVAAAAHLMSAHGRQQQVKDDFKQQQGIPTMLWLMAAQQLPMPAKAAAAACIWHYLAPQPTGDAGSNSSSTNVGQPLSSPGATAGAAGGMPVPAKGIFGLPPPASTGILDVAAAGRRLTAAAARSNLIAAAKSARRQAQQQAGAAGARSSTSGTPQEGSIGAASSSTRGTSAPGGAGAAAAAMPGVGGDSILEQHGEAGAAAGAAAASYQAAVAAWQYAVAQGDMAARADHVIASGCVPALLLLCCGPDSPPASLRAAVDAVAAAAATAASRQPDKVSVDGASAAGQAGAAAAAGSAAADPAAGMSSARATSGSSSARGASSWNPGDLGAIAEPSHGELEEGSADAATAAHGGPGEAGAAAQEEEGSSRASSGKSGSREKKGKKGGKKKSAKLEPGMAEVQCAASAAVKLLVMSGEAGRAALLAAGAKQVLVPLLAAPTAVARWNARQALMLLSLAATDKRKVPASGSKYGSSSTSAAGAAREAAGFSTAGSSGVAALQPGLLAAAAADTAAGVPDYIAMANLPASHWQRSAPLTMPPLPVLPVIPGRRSAGSEQQQQQQQQQQGSSAAGAGSARGGGSAGALAGSGGSGNLRPNSHQQRRISMSSAAGAVMMTASRMSVSNIAANSSSNVASAEGSMPGTAGVDAGAAIGSKLAKQGARGSIGGAGSGAGSIPALGA